MCLINSTAQTIPSWTCQTEAADEKDTKTLCVLAKSQKEETRVCQLNECHSNYFEAHLNSIPCLWTSDLLRSMRNSILRGPQKQYGSKIELQMRLGCRLPSLGSLGWNQERLRGRANQPPPKTWMRMRRAVVAHDTDLSWVPHNSPILFDSACRCRRTIVLRLLVMMTTSRR